MEKGGGGGGKKGEYLNSSSKTLILKDSSIRSTYTHLTASPCYTTNTDKHGNITNNTSMNEQCIQVPTSMQKHQNYILFMDIV